MARRKEFKTIADGLLSSFISRNNDVQGYWGIGKLYSHMLQSNSMTIVIDLITERITPDSFEFQCLTSGFADRLQTQVKNQKINRKHLSSAELILTGFPNEPIPSLGQYAPNRMNCRFIITDDLGKKHICEKNVWCREHNPEKELRSTRACKNK